MTPASGRSETTNGDRGEQVTPARPPVDPRRTKVAPADAYDLAVEWFHAGRRIDLQAIARELGVSRMTVHRWVGTRDQLLVETLWKTADRALTRLQARTRTHSGCRTAHVLSAWVQGLLRHPGFLTMQAEENELLTRLTTRDASEFQRRLVARVRQMLEHDVDEQRISVDLDLDDLAYAAVRIAESFVHTRAITGAPPDSARASRVLHALIR